MRTEQTVLCFDFKLPLLNAYDEMKRAHVAKQCKRGEDGIEREEEYFDSLLKE